MKIVVCVKRVPLTQEVDLEIDDNKKDIRKEALPYMINEWDNYAVEEAVLMKEKFGGTVTAITIGSEDDEEILRRAMAMGADQAIRIDPAHKSFDNYAVSRVLAEVIKEMDYNLILTGVHAGDDNCGTVGIMLAEHLDLAHAAVVTGINAEGNEVTIKTELEGGVDEVSKISLPALLTIQTGINEPRYVSIIGIKKAKKKELQVIHLVDLSISGDDIAPHTFIEEMYLPPETTGAKIIEGNTSAVADEIIRILIENGVSI
jgi:electron transfer flavoprotein beta subunit